jgi:hypothetical protein
MPDIHEQWHAGCQTAPNGHFAARCQTMFQF